jgi:SCY1-like protein 1
MFKFLKEVVAGSGSGLKDFPYTIGEPYASAWGSWTHHRGTSKVRSPPFPSPLDRGRGSI